MWIEKMNFNKKDVRDLYKSIVHEGLFKSTSIIEHKYKYVHIEKSLQECYNVLLSLENRKDLFYEQFIRYDSIDAGEYLVEIIDYMPKKESLEELKKIFNELQLKIPFGIYMEIV